jgi:ferredoxin
VSVPPFSGNAFRYGKERVHVSRKEDLEFMNAEIRDLAGRLHWLNLSIARVQQGRGVLFLKPVVDPEACFGCGVCEERCPEGAISVETTASIDLTRCMVCGQCLEVCPKGAISLRPQRRCHGP